VDLAMTVTVTITITSKLHLVSTSVAMKPKSGYDSHDQMETRLKYECRETYPIYHGSVIIITNIYIEARMLDGYYTKFVNETTFTLEQKFLDL
jgi:hypothetical protein